jgi:hypothetical protein
MNEVYLGASACRPFSAGFCTDTRSGIDGMGIFCNTADAHTGPCGRSDLPMLSQLVGKSHTVMKKW